jgi:hypothetical protein
MLEEKRQLTELVPHCCRKEVDRALRGAAWSVTCIDKHLHGVRNNSEHILRRKTMNDERQRSRGRRGFRNSLIYIEYMMGISRDSISLHAGALLMSYRTYPSISSHDCLNFRDSSSSCSANMCHLHPQNCQSDLNITPAPIHTWPDLFLSASFYLPPQICSAPQLGSASLIFAGGSILGTNSSAT